jgi:hypothetical protein
MSIQPPIVNLWVSGKLLGRHESCEKPVVRLDRRAPCAWNCSSSEPLKELDQGYALNPKRKVVKKPKE